MGVLGVLICLHLAGVGADSLLSVLDSLVRAMDGGGVYNRDGILN